MSPPSGKAVFLSYASQDAEAARRICEALRAAGLEVWFDQSELRGGDAWDQKIRKQIRDCALFLPVISANTNARLEGYFRREWKLAVDRTHDMADEKAFLVPVVIDATTDAAASVPEKFREVQWTRLPGGAAPSEFCSRVSELLGGARLAPVSERRSGQDRAVGAGPGMPPPRTRSRLALSAAALAVAVILGAALFLARKAPPPAVGVAAGAKSIAVLPFANLSDDKDSGYFADGVHEDILTDLANLPELRIVSRPSVQRYRNTKKSMREIAAELGVAYILEGSVRRAGNTVRVTGQLIRAATDEYVWAQHYDRELKDVFAIQSALATEIARALQTAISPAERARIEWVATKVPAAYDRLLRARHILYDNPETTEENFRRAEALLQEAVELDPNYAVAWSYLADLHANFVFQNFDASPERRERAKAAIERALQLDPGRPEVIRNYGAYFYHALRDYARAGEQYRRALALLPGDCESHMLLAWLLRRLGHWAEALHELARAFELDSANVTARSTYVPMLVAARRYDEALRKLAPVIKREQNPFAPPRMAPGLIRFFATGSTDTLAELLEAIPAEKRSGPDYFERLHQLAMYKGQWSEAARIAQENKLPWEDPIEEAAVQLALGHDEAARRQLEALLAQAEAWLKQSSRTAEPLKLRARAAALLGRTGPARAYLEEARTRIFAAHDAMDEAGFEAVEALVLLWTGDKQGALRALAAHLQRPGPFPGNVHVLRRSPLWRPLHGDPQFEALLNDPKSSAQLF